MQGWGRAIGCLKVTSSSAALWALGHRGVGDPSKGQEGCGGLRTEWMQLGRGLLGF